MSHTITAKLNEDARVFQAGESTGFGFRLGERYYNRETSKSEYTNYEGAVFSKNANQIEFLKSAMVKGAIVTVSCDQLKIDSFTADSGTTYLRNQMQNCRMDNVFTSDLPSHAPTQQPAQGTGFNQPPAQAAPQAAPQSFGSFGAAPDQRWSGVKGTAMTNGATIEQIQKKFNGSFDEAQKAGAIEPNSPNFDDFDDSIPF